MTREEALEKVKNEIVWLEEEENISRYMEEGDEESVREIMWQVYYNSIRDFLRRNNLNILESEIEDKYLLALVAYIKFSGMPDEKFLKNYEVFRKRVGEICRDIGKSIAFQWNFQNLKDIPNFSKKYALQYDILK